MPHFIYRAKKGPTAVVDGSIEAGSQDEAVEKLSQMGLLPITLSEGPPEASLPADSPKKNGEKKEVVPRDSAILKKRLFSRIKSSEITIFGRQLAGLVKAGVPILRAIWIISEQSDNPRFRAVLDHAQDEIKNGRTLSSVLAEYPKLFPPVYIAMVRTGEDSGTLQEALMRISDYRQRQEEILSRVKTAMAYPILMAVTGIGTIAFMLTFVIPKLTGLFSTMGGSLPLPTKILMKISSYFQMPLFWIVTAVAIFAAVILLKTRTAQMKVLWSRLSLSLPLVKDFILKAELARLTRTLELLIKSGTPILRSIEITTPVLSNTVLRDQFGASHDEIMGGSSLGKSLKSRKIFPLFMTNLILVGEETGKLDDSLSEIAVFYERETDEKIKIMTSLLEPLMILVMGLIVGFIVIAMLLPMFELNMMVK
jgi:type II secretory pathway component PulF